MSSHAHSDPRVLADISALADGSLPADRVDEVQARAAAPELGRLLADERRAVDAVRAFAANEHAPHRLRLKVDAARATRRERAGSRRPAAALGALGAVVVAILVVLLIPGGSPGGPSLAQAAGLANRGPTAAAPMPDPHAPDRRLNQGVGEVYFPRWASSFGWRATGQRTDRLGGRRAVTVFYRRGGQTVAYTILSAPPIQVATGSRFHAGHVFGEGTRLGARHVVTWRRAGLTCVISSTDAPAAELQQLAGWAPAGSTA